MTMSEDLVRTVVIALLLVGACIALVVLVSIGTEFAREVAVRLEGAIAVLVPAFVHSLSVTMRRPPTFGGRE